MDMLLMCAFTKGNHMQASSANPNYDALDPCRGGYDKVL